LFCFISVFPTFGGFSSILFVLCHLSLLGLNLGMMLVDWFPVDTCQDPLIGRVTSLLHTPSERVEVLVLVR
jgi:hypothetical protein